MKSKDTVILHIGMHKTATTSIQSGLKAFTDGITRYARLGPSNHSIPVITVFRQDPSRHLYYLKRGVDQAATKVIGKEFREKLRGELQGPERNLIISGEEICRLTPSEVRRMKTFLEPHCDRFRILAYIREPLGYASSVLQQVARHRQITELSVPAPNYRTRFSKFIEEFGREAVEFVLFDLAAFRNGCIITDFCDRVGIAADGIAKRTKNESLSTESVALLLDWNRHGIKGPAAPGEVKAMNRLIALLRNEFPGKFRIHHELVSAQIDEDDCAWMERQAGFSVFAAGDVEREGGVRSDAELALLAEASAPRLRGLLEARSLTAQGDRPAAMMDALFLSQFDTSSSTD